MWSVGCILAELLAKKPIFPGRSEIDQLELTYKLCGTPNDENWPNAEKLAWWETFKPQKVYKRRVREAFKEYDFLFIFVNILDLSLSFPFLSFPFLSFPFPTFPHSHISMWHLINASCSFPPEALDLVDRLLTMDPNKRISASEALDSDYFWTEPFPPEPSSLPKYPPSHEFQAKKRRQQGSSSQQDPTKRPRVDQQALLVLRQPHQYL